jgi:hypothetical protein
MARRSVKKEFPSSNSILISEDEIGQIPHVAQQHTRDPSETPSPVVVMSDKKDSQLDDSMGHKGMLLFRSKLVHACH